MVANTFFVLHKTTDDVYECREDEVFCNIRKRKEKQFAYRLKGSNDSWKHCFANTFVRLFKPMESLP